MARLPMFPVLIPPTINGRIKRRFSPSRSSRTPRPSQKRSILVRATRPAPATRWDARVSTNDQNLEGQRVRLIEAGAIRVFVDVVSGKRFERPGLAELIDHARPGDRLCVTRLDRLGRSLRELLETVDALKARGIHLVSLEERLDTSSAAGELVFHVFGAIGTSTDGSSPSEPATASPRRENADERRAARLSTRTPFPPLRNSSMQGCRPLERHNNSASAGQRLSPRPLNEYKPSDRRSGGHLQRHHYVGFADVALWDLKGNRLHAARGSAVPIST